MKAPSEQLPEDLVTIRVATRYLPDHLPEDTGKYAFAYQVTVTNQNEFPVTLRSRYWLITDANSKQSEVSGDGVVGKQPTIEPGDTFQYTSGAVIETEVGVMQGYYEMESNETAPFRVAIAPFTLAVPNIIN